MWLCRSDPAAGGNWNSARLWLTLPAVPNVPLLQALTDSHILQSPYLNYFFIMSDLCPVYAPFFSAMVSFRVGWGLLPCFGRSSCVVSAVRLLIVLW